MNINPTHNEVVLECTNDVGNGREKTKGLFDALLEIAKRRQFQLRRLFVTWEITSVSWSLIFLENDLQIHLLTKNFGDFLIALLLILGMISETPYDPTESRCCRVVTWEGMRSGLTILGSRCGKLGRRRSFSLVKEQWRDRFFTLSPNSNLLLTSKHERVHFLSDIVQIQSIRLLQSLFVSPFTTLSRQSDRMREHGEEREYLCSNEHIEEVLLSRIRSLVRRNVLHTVHDYLRWGRVLEFRRTFHQGYRDEEMFN